MKATVTNPQRSKGSRKSTTKKTSWHKSYKNPEASENPRKKRAKKRVKNPLSKSDLMDGLKIAVGTLGGVVASFAINKYVAPSVPGFAPSSAMANFRGVLEAVPGAAVLAFGGKNPFIKGAGIGLVAGGGYDVVAKNAGSSLGMPALGEERVQYVPIKVPMVGVERAPTVGVERAPTVGVERAPTVGGEELIPTVRQGRVGGMIFN